MHRKFMMLWPLSRTQPIKKNPINLSFSNTQFTLLSWHPIRKICSTIFGCFHQVSSSYISVSTFVAATILDNFVSAIFVVLFFVLLAVQFKWCKFKRHPRRKTRPAKERCICMAVTLTTRGELRCRCYGDRTLELLEIWLLFHSHRIRTDEIRRRFYKYSVIKRNTSLTIQPTHEPYKYNICICCLLGKFLCSETQNQVRSNFSGSLMSIQHKIPLATPPLLPIGLHISI